MAIDLRSDTVTRPTESMREAMARAPVGDDVFGDDPTVNALQEEVADYFGREAALFVPSGTMANQIALLCHTRPGDHVLVPSGAHVVHYESGAGGAIAGVQFRELGSQGRYDLDELSGAVQPNDHHHPPTSLVTVENTHNRGGGRVVSVDHMAAIRRVADTHELAFHMDGARFFNAVAAGIDPRESAALVDSLGFCFSKGLGAPVGSMLVGDEAFIHRAHRYRKMLGGAMRQVGVLAAAGRHALQHHVERLSDDHARARCLAEGLNQLEAASVDLTSVETNIVYMALSPTTIDGQSFVEGAREQGLLCYATAPRTVRFVTHLDVDDDDIDQALQIASTLLGHS